MNPLILVNGQHAYPADTAQDLIPEIGRASCRERVCLYV